MLSKPMARIVYLFRDTTIDDWSNVKEVVVEVRLDARLKRIVDEALQRKIPLRGGNAEAMASLDSHVTGANI